MKIVSDSLSKQEEICKKFSEKYSIPMDDIYAKADELYPNILEKECERNFKKLLKENPDLNYEDCKEEIKSACANEARRKSLVRGRSFFKRQASKNQRIQKDGKSCFIVMRFRDGDFEPRAYQKIADFVIENGEEAAKEKGYINNKGEYVHTSFTTSFENQYGNKINKDNYRGSAVGFFEVEDPNGGTSYEPRFIYMGYARNKYIPIGKPATVVVKEGDNDGPLFKGKKVYFYNEGKSEVDDDILSIDLINHINTLYDKFLGEGKFAENYDELIEISEQQIDDCIKPSYVGIIATCTSIGQRDDPDKDIPCEFEIYDEFGDIETITVWVPVSHFKGMSIIEDQQGVLFLTDMYYSKDGNEIKYHLGGFLPFESGELQQ